MDSREATKAKIRAESLKIENRLRTLYAQSEDIKKNGSESKQPIDIVDPKEDKSEVGVFDTPFLRIIRGILFFTIVLLIIYLLFLK